MTRLPAGSDLDLSIIIPVFNERDAIADLVEEILTAFEGLAYEVVLVNDCSDDGSGDAIDLLARHEERVRAIHHPRRSGKSAALRSGAVAARGRWMGTLDGDGQDIPGDLRRMTEEVDLGAVGAVGVVGGVRKQRTDGSSRKWASRLANNLRRSLLRDDCPDTACGLKLMPRDVFLALPFFDALHRYFPALIQHLGFEARYVPVDNRPRTYGVSKYSNIGRAAAGAVDLLGVMWLMRRTHVPDRALLLRPEETDA